MRRAVCFVAVFTAGLALACKCDTSSAFLDNAMSGAVVVVRVETPGAEQVKVVVEKQLAGPKLEGALTVEGGDGGNCNASVGRFAKGERVVMVLPAKGRHDLNGCGTHSLSLEKDVVKGHIAEGVTSLPLAELEARVKAAQKAYKAFTGQ
jgi:hypothetical protein